MGRRIISILRRVEIPEYIESRKEGRLLKKIDRTKKKKESVKAGPRIGKRERKAIKKCKKFWHKEQKDQGKKGDVYNRSSTKELV